MVTPLHGKRALITGAASGIGRATALALRDAGATVLGFDLKASEGDIPILACDLANEADIIAAVRQGAERIGG
ncbi:SDR family NAD(P)-dependent oxidoreductase, partial [Mesorhizobium sp. M7A.T.Ca.TU.009.01.3.1]